MGDVIELHGQPVRPEDNHELVVDLARFAEGIATEAAVKKRHHYSDDDWEKLGDNEKLIEAVEAQKILRVRNGAAKRERAQQLVVQGADVLGTIMLDATMPPRNRIDSVKALDGLAGNGPEGVPAADRFVIQINLGADVNGKPIVEKYDKSIKIDPWDVDPNDEIGLTPEQRMLANSTKGDDDGAF